MATLRDWYKLADETFTNLDQKGLRTLYSHEWPEGRRRLVEEHREAIDRAPNRIRKRIREESAVLHGLARRLAPARRVVFFFALLFAISAGLSAAFREEPSHQIVPNGVLVGISLVALVSLLGLELVDKLQFKDELELARDLQADLIPRELPKLPGFEFCAYNRISNTVGGDVYDFVALPDGRLAVLFGDASGHGMKAGLLMAIAQAAFRTQLEVDPKPTAILETMNRILCRAGGPRAFFSAVYVLLEPDGNFSIGLAGHPAVRLLAPDGGLRSLLGRGSYPLGIKPTTDWDVSAGRLEPGEALFLVSDGVPEARNGNGVELGDYSIDRTLATVGSAAARQRIEAVVKSLGDFCGPIPPEDDVTIAIALRNPVTG